MPQFRVQVLEVMAPWGFTRHMKVQRADGKSGISWDDLQRLKDEHLGPDVLAVELYPRRIASWMNSTCVICGRCRRMFCRSG